MTIFDSIKYQISDRPSYEELEAIPQSIWIEFLKCSNDMSNVNYPRTLAFMYISSIEWHERTAMLRRVILEYDTI